MSSTTQRKYSVALAGVGNLGTKIAQVFLQDPRYRSSFDPIYLLTRKASPDLEKLRDEFGAKIVEVDLGSCGEENSDALNSAKVKLGGHVDVVVNTLSSRLSEAKRGLFKLALETGASVYFPSEFGIEHSRNTFEFENKEWTAKKHHTLEARQIASERNSHIRILEVSIGLFIEDSLGPWCKFTRFSLYSSKLTSELLVGMDIPSSAFTSIGPASTHASYTSKSDVGKAVAELALLAMTKPDVIPDNIRIAGDSLSIIEVAALVEKFSGKRITIKEEDVGKFKQEVQANYKDGKSTDAAPFIRVVMGEGKLDWRTSNHNQLVNPDESRFKWFTVASYLEGVKGEPTW